MDQVSLLRRYGLFDAKVPRYTSYPPANRFASGVGARHHGAWLEATESARPISVYVHIPFCRRLCWFCACRTQGTKTLTPVERYVEFLLREIEATTSQHLPSGISMARLHFGGGTPTLLSTELISKLLDRLRGAFQQTSDFEFSVEVDPTEAAPDVLESLSSQGMTRASIGVQDFAPKVQEAIGRAQSFEETMAAVERLRSGGVRSLNIDLLYGLPYQTKESLLETLDLATSLNPDRLALYGYAHVPHVSKRQVMIPDEALPGAEERFILSQIAKYRLERLGYVALGIDHFAMPTDSLAKAARAGHMTRNFQGYTDDPCETLIGFGASAISRFPQGYTQNAVSTSAYQTRIETSGTAAHKGVVLSDDDRLRAVLIDALMCKGQIGEAAIRSQFRNQSGLIDVLLADLAATFPDLLTRTPKGLVLPPDLSAAARLIAAHLDSAQRQEHIHSLAI